MTTDCLTRWLCGVAMMLMVLPGCRSAMEIRSEVAPHVETQRYQTYKLLEHQVARHASTESLIEGTIHRSMKARGFTRVEDNGEADLLISYKVLLSAQDEVTPEASSPMEASPLQTSAQSEPFLGAPADEWGDAGMGNHFLHALSATESERQKVVLVMFQDAQDLSVVWVGWSSDEVQNREMTTSTGQAISGIMARVPWRQSMP